MPLHTGVGLYLDCARGGGEQPANFHAFGSLAGVIKALVRGQGPVTFSRNSEPTFQDWEGITRKAAENEIRIQLARRVRNHFRKELFNAINWRSFNNSTYVDGPDKGQIDMGFAAVGAPGRVENAILIYSGAGNLVGEDFLVSFDARTITAESGRGFQCQLGRYTGGSSATHLTTFAPTDQWQRFVLDGYPNFTDPANEGLRVSFWGFDAGSGDITNLSVKNIQIERVTGQADQNPRPIPGEYTSPDTDYGMNAESVQVFAHQNGTIVLDDVAYYSKGADLTTAWGGLFDPIDLEDPSGIFDFNNFDITKGSFVFDITMAAASNQGIINFANVQPGICSYDTVNQFQTNDGTNQANVDPNLATNLGDTIRFAVLYGLDGLRIGYKNVTDAGPWVWDTNSASFNGGFPSDSVFNVFRNLATKSTMRDLYYYANTLTTEIIEATFP